MIRVPRLAQGKGYRGPEFWGCCNTGTAPSIFHSRNGRYVVGPEMACRDAMQNGVTFGNKRIHGDGRQRVWLYKSRKPAVAKFMALCGARIMENETVRREYMETRAKAAKGDIAAAIHLGDF